MVTACSMVHSTILDLVRASVISDLISEQAFVHVEEKILGKFALLHKFLKEPLYSFCWWG